MKMETIRKLRPGDQVYWNDPDKGLCSRFYTIKTIEILEGLVFIEDIEGDSLECFPQELS